MSHYRRSGSVQFPCEQRPFVRRNAPGRMSGQPVAGRGATVPPRPFEGQIPWGEHSRSVPQSSSRGGLPLHLQFPVAGEHEHHQWDIDQYAERSSASITSNIDRRVNTSNFMRNRKQAGGGDCGPTDLTWLGATWNEFTRQGDAWYTPEERRIPEMRTQHRDIELRGKKLDSRGHVENSWGGKQFTKNLSEERSNPYVGRTSYYYATYDRAHTNDTRYANSVLTENSTKPQRADRRHATKSYYSTHVQLP